MDSSFLIDGIRTPIGQFCGSLSTIRTDDLAAMVIAELVRRNPSIPTEQVDEVILGCSNQAGEDNRNVARMALLLAGLPWSIPGETVNRLCASSMSATIHAQRAIQSGDGNIFITGGVENMTRGPWVISKVSKAFGRDSQMYDSSFGWRFVNPKMKSLYGTHSMGETAENLAQRYHIQREAQDLFAYKSQMKATQAASNRRHAQEIMQISIPQRKKEPIEFANDEFIKPHTTLEGLSGLKPAFLAEENGGTVTAGNSSGLNDGACALLVASSTAIKGYDLSPVARIVASAVVGVEPKIMGIGPVRASVRALAKAGLTLDDMGIIEINEAFAVQCLACFKELNLSPDDPRINPNGGAIALGHPLGMSGARILWTAALELQQQNKQYALVTMCVGVGQGYAVILEKA